MKPHDETWNHDGDCLVYFSASKYGVADFDPDTGDQGRDESVARAKLAAQAPKMARLLLEAMQPDLRADEWGCPFCGHSATASAIHASNCAGWNVLRAAGVVP